MSDKNNGCSGQSEGCRQDPADREYVGQSERDDHWRRHGVHVPQSYQQDGGTNACLSYCPPSSIHCWQYPTSQCGLNSRCDKPPPVRHRQYTLATDEQTDKSKDIAVA